MQRDYSVEVRDRSLDEIIKAFVGRLVPLRRNTTNIVRVMEIFSSYMILRIGDDPNNSDFFGEVLRGPYHGARHTKYKVACESLLCSSRAIIEVSFRSLSVGNLVVGANCLAASV